MLSDKVDVARLSSFFTAERPELFIETKLDGERVQIHKDPSGNFRYFSRFGEFLCIKISSNFNCFLYRNGFDFSTAFGQNQSGGSLTHRLVKALEPSVSSFILDGEMMAWDTKSMTFKQKGRVNSFTI